MKQYRILWADDEIDLLRPHVLFLEKKGYEVITVNNGDDALEKCQNEHFDIVFLDENMPGKSGLDTLLEIKDISAELPVVMITKSEEENIMEQAVGRKISDYLIKPVNPNQILLSIKKNIEEKQIVEDHTIQNYQSEFQKLAMQINFANNFDDFKDVYRKLVNWELRLAQSNKSLDELLLMQKNEANSTFCKYICRNYEEWFGKNKDNRPMMSHDIFKTKIFPLLDAGEKVFLIVIDNFRYDQWRVIREMLTDFYKLDEEELYCSILPTATQYSRNAIFSGLMPLQIKEMYPQYWIEEEEEEGKNLYEKELIQTQLDRFRKKYTFSYYKVNESQYGKKLIETIPNMLQNDFNTIVFNFVDMMSHARTESKIIRELAGNEAAYRSLTASWFLHSSTIDFFRTLAEKKVKVVITTDHGTIHVDNAIKVIGDKNTNVNLRYKVGKMLNYNPKEVFEIKNPKKIGLPAPNLSSTYIFAQNSDFMAYPNNYNYYVSYYQNTFQHGGISLEEMILPVVTLSPK